VTLAQVVVAAWFLTQHFGAAQRTPVDDRFGDRITYQDLADAPLLSAELLAGERPPALPLLMRAVGVDLRDNTPGAFETLTLVQEALSGLAWVALAAALAASLGTAPLRLVAFTGVLTFWAGRDVSGWNRVILSESLALTAVAAALATGLTAVATVHAPPRPLARLVAALALLGALALGVATRDVLAWVLPAVVLAAAAAAVGSRAGRGVYGLIALGAAGLFGASQLSASIGQRWVAAALNVMSARVFPIPEEKAWWVARGMPDNDITARFDGRQSVFIPYDMDAEWSAFIDGPMHGLYTRWLLSHPVENVLAPLREWAQVLGEHPCQYFQHRVVEWVLLAEQLSWPVGAAAVLLVAAGAIGLVLGAARAASRPAALVLLLALALVYPLAFITWHGDTYEHVRHFALTNILLRFLGWAGLVVGLDTLINWRRSAPPPPRSAPRPTPPPA